MSDFVAGMPGHYVFDQSFADSYRRAGYTVTRDREAAAGVSARWKIENPMAARAAIQAKGKR